MCRLLNCELRGEHYTYLKIRKALDSVRLKHGDYICCFSIKSEQFAEFINTSRAALSLHFKIRYLGVSVGIIDD